MQSLKIHAVLEVRVLNTTRSLLIGVAVLLLAGCSLGNTGNSQPASLTPGSSLDAGTEVAGDDLDAGPALPALEALSALMPSFDGLYWTSDLLVETHGSSSLRVLAGMPCDQVLSLLSSGEWLLTKQVPANEQTNGMIPALALMERKDESLFLKLKDIVSGSPIASVTQQVAADPTPTLDLGAAPLEVLDGCQVNITRLVSQSIEAHGVEEAQGTALAYPLLMDCLVSPDGVTVSQFYEGSGDFRAFLQFDAPNTIGEYPINSLGLSLNIYHTPMSVMDFMGQTGTEGDGSSMDSLGTAFSAASDESGLVTVLSLDPLTGEVQLNNLRDESGNSQTFRAGFQCGW